jgi:hypothetical protein
LIVFSLHQESLKLILVNEPLPEVVLSHLVRTGRLKPVSAMKPARGCTSELADGRRSPEVLLS